MQDNLSSSRRGVLRGLHFQEPHPQGKLVYAMRGEILDVAVDIRVGSPRFLQWVGVTLSGENRRQIYVPPGFAHGFVVLSESALVAYKCTEVYHPEAEASLPWDDPRIGIAWPVGLPPALPQGPHRAPDRRHARGASAPLPGLNPADGSDFRRSRTGRELRSRPPGISNFERR